MGSILFDLLVKLGLGHYLLPPWDLHSARYPWEPREFLLDWHILGTLSPGQVSLSGLLGRRPGIPELAWLAPCWLLGCALDLNSGPAMPQSLSPSRAGKLQRSEVPGPCSAPFSQILCFRDANGRENIC